MPAVVRQLRDTGAFEDLPLDVDEAEHSVEMHLSYLVKLMNGYTTPELFCSTWYSDHTTVNPAQSCNLYIVSHGTSAH